MDIDEITVEFPRAVFATAFVIDVFVIVLLLFMNYILKVKGTPPTASILFGCTI